MTTFLRRQPRAIPSPAEAALLADLHDERAKNAELEKRVAQLHGELATVDRAYDEIGDRLVRAEAKLAGRDAWIRRAVAILGCGTLSWHLDVKDLLDTAPEVGE